MKAMKAKLIQTVTYTAEGNKKKHEVSVIAKLDGEFMRIDIYFQFPNCFFKLFDQLEVFRDSQKFSDRWFKKHKMINKIN